MRVVLATLALSGCGFVSKGEWQTRVGGGPSTDPNITNSSWIIHQAPIVDGQEADIAVDSDGTFHIVYRDMTRRELVYAFSDGLGGWTSTTLLETPDDTINPTAIAVGSDGLVHIAYSHHANDPDFDDNGVNEVRYLRLGGEGDSFSGLIDDLETRFLDIVVEDGYARVAYLPFDANNGGIKFATINGEPPFNEAIMAIEGGQHINVVPDGDGWAVSHNTEWGNSVVLTRGSGDDYTAEYVCEDCQAEGTAIAMEGDTAHVAWYEIEGEWDGPGMLKYANSATGWEPIVIDHSAAWAEDMWMGINGDGVPWICYGHDEGWGSGNIRLAHLDGDTWHIEQIGNSGDNDLWCHGDTAPDGSLHVLTRQGSLMAEPGFQISSNR